MMTVLYIFLGVVLLILILVVIAPKTYNVSRSIEINQPKDVVFAHLKSLKKQNEWSPWAKRDPNMQERFTGTDGEVGAINHWNGNRQVGQGEQEITKIVEGERVESQLRFLKPFKSISDAYLVTESVGADRTKVTWGFSGQNKFPMNIMMMFMSMDKAVGKDFEEGLSNLKEIMEK